MGKRKMMLVSFMLFSLFFGAGNLIFPPFLGQNAGESTPLAIGAFLITAVLLPVLGVIVVADFDGLDNLARKVDHRFAIVFTVLIYLSIGRDWEFQERHLYLLRWQWHPTFLQQLRKLTLLIQW